MRPIGGYLELESGSRPLYHKGAYLNSGRNALRLVIRSHGIRRLHVPSYTCATVFDAIAAENCEVVQYELDENLMPTRQFDASDYIVYNNYFGVCGQKVAAMAARYPNLIVDNAQAFYAKPCGLASIYSPRKFFGLPDGGIAVGEGLVADDLPIDVSYERVSHLLKRIDLGPEAAYEDFRANSEMLAQAPVAQMSRLTKAMMTTLDYELVAQKRKSNFMYLHTVLNSSFPFSFSEDDVPLVYPYITDDSTLRMRLIGNKIFAAKYWPNLIRTADSIANRILAMPIDQRYEDGDMERIAKCVREFS